MTTSSHSDVPRGLAASIADIATQHELWVAVAESLTGGAISSHLSAAPGSATWFRGAVVAYSASVKFDLMGVPEGPVVTQECAVTMAGSAAKLLDADATVAVTGVGGPDAEEGHPAGTVWFGLMARGDQSSELRHFAGEPEDVVRDSTEHALRLLLEAVRRLAADDA